MKSTLPAFIERMTRREKVLVGAFFGIFMFLSLGLGTGMAIHHVSTIQEEIADLEQILTYAQISSSSYLDAVETEKELEEKIKQNQIQSLRIPINNIAKKFKLPSEDSSSRNDDLADIVRFEGLLEHYCLYP